MSTLISNNCVLDASQTQSNPQYLYINGELRIDVNYTFSPGTELIMGENAQIVIQPNSNIELKILTTNIHGCERRWNGIAVTNTSTIKIRASTIQDSNRGIVLFDGSNSGIEYNTFKNNMVSISTPFLNQNPSTDLGIPNISSPLILYQYAGGIIGNSFIITDALLPSQTDPFTETCGIYLEWNANLQIGRNKGSNFNSFDNLYCGIRIKNGEVEISDSKFLNIGNSSSQSYERAIFVSGNLVDDNNNSYNKLSKIRFTGIGKNGGIIIDNCTQGVILATANFSILDVHFGRVKYGIEAGGRYFRGIITNNRIDDFEQNGMDITYPINSLAIENNDVGNSIASIPPFFPDHPTGITLTGPASTFIANFGVTVKNNVVSNETIEANQSSVYGLIISTCGKVLIEGNSLTSIDYKFTAMSVGLSEECTIKENTIILNPASPNGTFSEGNGGMTILNSAHNRISCNTINGFAESIGFGFNCDGSDIYSNTMTNGVRYLNFLYPQTITDVQINKMNLWSDNNNGSSTKIEAYWENGVNQFLSRFYADNQQVNQYPDPLNGPNGWFYNQSFPNEGYPCVNYCGPNDDPNAGLKNQLTRANIALLNDSLSFPRFNESYRWEVKRQLFEKLNKFPNLLNLHPAASNFYYTNSNGSLGQLQNIMLALESILVPSNSLAFQIRFLDSISSVYNLEIQQLNGQILIETNPINKSSLISQLVSKYTLAQSNTATSDSLIGAWNATKQSTSSTIASNLNAISTSNIPESKLKEVLGVVLSSIQSGNYPSFSNAQIQDLEAIAGTCGLEGGRGVYWARELLRKSNGFYNDDILCLPPPAPLATEDNAKSIISIYPNPVENTIYLNLPKFDGKMDYTITNAVGVIVARGFISQNTINVNELMNGLYILNLNSNQLDFHAIKFIKK